LLAKQAHYVATSYSSNLLKRIVAFGLGNRGRCDVFSGDSGIVLVRKGEPDLAIETKAIISVELADHAIDRGVEADGLIRINWLNGEIQVSTFIRAATRQQQKMIFQKFHSLAAKEAIK
ncbi:MAG: hypothetical protein RL556_754, partial [Actinomycetota bacterium]